MCNINIKIKPGNFEENRCIYFIENRPIYLNGLLGNLYNRFKLPFFDANTTTGVYTTIGPRGGPVYHRGNQLGDLTLLRTTKSETFSAKNADTKFKTGSQKIYMNINMGDVNYLGPHHEQLDSTIIHQMVINSLAFHKKNGFVSVIIHSNNGSSIWYKVEYEHFIKNSRLEYIRNIDKFIVEVGVDCILNNQ